MSFFFTGACEIIFFCVTCYAIYNRDSLLFVNILALNVTAGYLTYVRVLV